MSLSETIKDRATIFRDRCAISSQTGRLNYSDLIDAEQKLHGKNVVLFVKDILQLVKALVILDGAALSICPVSTQVGYDELRHIIVQSEFDLVVTDFHGNELNVFYDLNLPVMEIETAFLEKDDGRSVLSNVDTNWLIPTSGTTTLPKLVRHTSSTLGAAALRRSNYCEKTEIWGQFYDISRFAGYQILFNSLLNGQTLIASSHGVPIAERVELCIKERVTHISATPIQRRKILMLGERVKLIPLTQIVLGGEAADQKVLDALGDYFPNAKITHTYASTEAGLGFYVSDGFAGFPLKFLEVSESSTEIKIENDRLFLRGPCNAMDYVAGASFKDSDGWIDTGDIVKIVGERFFILGRVNGILNVGGDKVNPEQIRHIT